MKKIRHGLIALWMVICSVISAEADVSIGIGLPTLSIGINLPLFPELVPVPGYPVYYAPRLNANYFFYDGMYWVYQDDYWYASSWYNGPWAIVEPEIVPLFILRIPVRYYQQPPVYFRGWQANAPPRWGQHWGRGWEERRGGWDKWQRSSAPTRAPLPVYQRKFSGDRYPRVEQQRTLQTKSYRYQPRDTAVRQHFNQQSVQKAPAPAERGMKQQPAMRSPRQQDTPRSAPAKQVAPASPRPQPQHQTAPQQRAPAIHDQKQQPPPEREQQAPRSQSKEQKPQDRGASQEPNRGQGQGQNRDEGRSEGQGQNRDEERGRGRNN